MVTGVGMFLATNAASGGTQKIGELFLGAGIKKCKDIKTKHEWKQLFVDTGEFCVKNIDNVYQLFDDISEIMSKKDMKQLAIDMKDVNGLKLKSALRQELSVLMQKYEVPYDIAEFCISSFINVIIDDIEKNNPEKFKDVFLNDWREEEREHLEIVKSRIDEVAEAVMEIQQRHLSIYSIDKIELDLISQTSNPKICLDFFEVDDEEFQLELENVLYNECIYVSGKCKEELIYCILYELRRINDSRATFVVKSHADWENLRIASAEKQSLNGKIFIPWFHADEIIAIPNNTNIFVYGEDEYCPGKNVLRMHKRTRHTIQTKLEMAGLDSVDAYRLVEDTHGLYIPLKKKIINGTYNKVPKWAEGDMQVVLPALLCGKWTEREGDISIIEFLAELKYDEFMERIHQYIIGEDPLLVKYTIHGTTFYQLASLENAWEYLDSKVLLESNLWKNFIDVIYDILIESDPIFEYPQEERHLKGLIKGIGTFWSKNLKHGVLRSLIMKAFYKKENENQEYVDDFVKKILYRITGKKQWLSISANIQLLCEASPKAVKQRLDDEWKNPTGLIEVFREKPEFNMFSTYEYLGFLHAIEQLLVQREYTAWAVRWLLKLSDFDITYPFSNSPMETLGKVFCAWINLVPLSVEEKKVLATEAIKKHMKGWDLILSELPGQKKSIISNLSAPNYRNIEEPKAATYADMNALYEAYIDICLKNMNGLGERWRKFIDVLDKCPVDTINDSFVQLGLEIVEMSDDDKIAIKNALRSEIHRHRYFGSAEWAMSEEKLSLFEDMMSSIHTKCKEYEYVYLFIPEYDFPLLNPVPYDREEGPLSTGKDNETMAKEEIQSGLLEFRKENLSVKLLIDICKSMSRSTLGLNLFKYYSDNTFDSNLFGYMINISEGGFIAIDYARAACIYNKSNLKMAISVGEMHNANEELLTELYAIEGIIDGEELPLIFSASENIKKIYWKRENLHVVDKTMAKPMMEECKIYGTQSSLFWIMHQVEKELSAEEILEYLEYAIQMEEGNLRHHPYDLTLLLEKIQNEFLFTDNCIRVAYIEIKYCNLLDSGNLKCLNRSLAIEPRLYASLAALIYVKENQKITDVTEEMKIRANNAYSIFMNIRFCPGEDAGSVRLNDIKEWVGNFNIALNQQNQESLFSNLLGRVLAYSPIGEDGFYPCEAVRDIIEIYGNRDLYSSYTISIFNERGVHSPTAGRAERELAAEYKNTANHLRVKYPKTAEIYDMMYMQYKREADSERESAEYADF